MDQPIYRPVGPRLDGGESQTYGHTKLSVAAENKFAYRFELSIFSSIIKLSWVFSLALRVRPVMGSM